MNNHRQADVKGAGFFFIYFSVLGVLRLLYTAIVPQHNIMLTQGHFSLLIL